MVTVANPSPHYLRAPPARATYHAPVQKPSRGVGRIQSTKVPRLCGLFRSATSFARSLISGTLPPSSALSTELSPAGEDGRGPQRSTLRYAPPTLPIMLLLIGSQTSVPTRHWTGWFPSQNFDGCRPWYQHLQTLRWDGVDSVRRHYLWPMFPAPTIFLIFKGCISRQLTNFPIYLSIILALWPAMIVL